MRSDEATTRDLAAALIQGLMDIKELCRRIPGNADIEASVSYTLTRLRGVHQNKEPQNEPS